jgi:hypothetical protein
VFLNNSSVVFKLVREVLMVFEISLTMRVGKYRVDKL